MSKCHYCDREVDEKTTKSIEYEEEIIFICENCLKEGYTHCDKCKRVVKESTTTEVNDDGDEYYVCEECLSNNYCECCGCGNFFLQSEMLADDHTSDVYCEACFSENREDEEDEEDDDDLLCELCHENDATDQFDITGNGDEIYICDDCLGDAQIRYILNRINFIPDKKKGIRFNSVGQSYLSNKNILSQVNRRLEFNIVKKTEKTDGYVVRPINIKKFITKLENKEEITFPDWYIEKNCKILAVVLENINTEYAKNLINKIIGMTMVKVNDKDDLSIIL